MATSPNNSSQNLSSPTSTRTSTQTISHATSSAVFVVNALEKIANTKEGRKNKSLKEVVQSTQSKYVIIGDKVFIHFLFLAMLKTGGDPPEGQTR